MSIKDQAGVDRNFSLVSQTGFDRTYACSNNPDANTVITVVQGQTRPSKAGIISVLNQVNVVYTDPTTKVVNRFTSNWTLKFHNSQAPTSVQLQTAAALCVRSLLPAIDGTSQTALIAVVTNAALGVMPTP